MIQLVQSLSTAERVLAAGFAASAALIIGAHGFERIGGYVPCVLCLDQREAHWAALGVTSAGLIAARMFKSRLGAAAALGTTALVYAVSAGLAFFHTGVEFGYWPGPAQCSAAAAVDIGAIGSALGQKATAPSCDSVQWSFLGVSMAGYNLLASAGLFAMTLITAITETHKAKAQRLSKAEPIS